MIDFARKNPGKVTYATPGTGTSLHIGMEQIAVARPISAACLALAVVLLVGPLFAGAAQETRDWSRWMRGPSR